MKKQLFIYLFAALTLGGVVTSCSDDDDKIVNLVPENTFTTESGLNLTYNGETLLGKQVTFTPSEDPTKATLTLKGVDFDLLGNITKAGESQMAFSTPGVLPGSATTEIALNLDILGDKCSFKGQDETEYCTFSYEGDVTQSVLNLNLTDVKLKNAALVGKLDVVPLIINEGGQATSNPLHLNWKSSEQLQIEIIPGVVAPMPIQDVLTLALAVLPTIEVEKGKKVTVIEALAAVFKDVRFGEDGNVTASIVDVANGKTDFEVSPKNLAFYVLDKMPEGNQKGQLRLFLNLASINALAKANASRADVDFSGIFKMLSKYTQNGIPLALVNGEDGKLTIMLDTELLKPIMTDVVAPLLSNEAVIGALITLIEQNEEMAKLAPIIKSVLKSLPAVLIGSEQIEIGLSFIPAK